MRLRNTVHRQASRRRWSVRKGRPSLEGLECRQLLSNGNGFVQGFAFNSSNSPVSGAAVQLLTTSNTLVASTTTNSDGYYAFNNVTPGTYNVAETAAGYSTSVSGSDIQTTINPASAINGNTEIQVTVLDLSQTSNPPPPPPTFTANWNGGIVGDTVSYQLLASPYNQGPVSGTATVGQLPFTLTGNQGNLTSIFTFCSDLFHDVFANNSYTVQASLTSNTTTLSPSTVPSYSTNLGEIGYLYNTFATNLSLGPSSSINTNGAALQVAFWALEYNVMPSSGPMTVTSPAHPGTPFSATGTSSAILSAADTYLADAYNNGTPKAEDAYFLNLYKPGANNSGQGMLSTDLLNFTNSPLSINTSQQPPTATVGTSIMDKATVSGGNNPTGTVTFNLYNNPNGTGTPLFTNTEPLSGGMATSAGYTATAKGTDYWVATYNGDSNNAKVSSGTAAEPVTITSAGPSINTYQQPATATVGTSDRRQGDRQRREQPDRHRHLQPLQQLDRERHAAVHRHRDALRRHGHLDGLHRDGDGDRLLGRHLQRRLQQQVGQQRHRRRAGGHQPGQPGDQHHPAAGLRHRRHLDRRQGDRQRRVQPHRHGHLQALRQLDSERHAAVHRHRAALRRHGHLGGLHRDRDGDRLLGRHLQRR